MQVHIINARNQWFYNDQVQQIFRQRYKLFAEELGWAELQNSSGLDIDDFDHEHVVYIAVINDVGEVEASCRISPSLYKNLSADKLSQFFETSIPKGMNIWDCSRWVPGTGNQRKLFTIAGYMWLGLHEFCFNYGISSVTGVASPGLMNMLLALGIPVVPLSTPVAYPEGSATGVHIKVDRESYVAIQKRFKLERPVSIELTSHKDNKTAFTPYHFSAISHIMSLTNPRHLEEVISSCVHLNASNTQPNMMELTDYLTDIMDKGSFQ